MVQVVLNRRAALVSGLAGLLFAESAAAAEIATSTGSRIPPDMGRQYIPPTSLSTIADNYKRMTAPVMVNGAGPFPFIVDTGANQSVISDTLAAQLELVVGPMQALNGVAGVMSAPSTSADLIIGSRKESAVPLSILPEEGIGGAGLLGLDRLDGQTLSLDFGKSEIRISRRASRDISDVSVRARRQSGQLTLLDAHLAGIKITAFLDSGAQSTIGNMALRDEAILRNPKSIWTRMPILSATGQTIEADFADLPALRLGGMNLPNWPVAFADLHTFRLWDLINKPAILVGVDIMSRFEQVRLDFEHDEVSFRLPRRA